MAPFVASTPAGEFYWQKVKTSGISPAPRWHHTVAVKAPSTLVLFGGFRSSSVRFNDLWLLDTKSDKWSQPPPGTTEESEDGKLFGFIGPELLVKDGAVSSVLTFKLPSLTNTHTVSILLDVDNGVHSIESNIVSGAQNFYQ